MLEQGWKAPILPPDLFSSGFYLLHHSAQERKGPWSMRGPRSLPHTHKHRTTSWRGKSLPLPRKPLPEAWTEFQTQGWPRSGPDRLRTCQPHRAGVGPEGSGGGWNAAKALLQHSVVLGQRDGLDGLPHTREAELMWDRRALRSSESLSGMKPLPVYSRTGKGPLLGSLLDVRSGVGAAPDRARMTRPRQ